MAHSQSNVEQLTEAFQRHYEYVGKLSSESTKEALNAARCKKFVRDIEAVAVTDPNELTELQDVVDQGAWTEVP